METRTPASVKTFVKRGLVNWLPITLPLLMFNASLGGNCQIAAITALLLLVPSVGFMLVIERFLRADVLARIGR